MAHPGGAPPLPAGAGSTLRRAARRGDAGRQAREDAPLPAPPLPRQRLPAHSSPAQPSPAALPARCPGAARPLQRRREGPGPGSAPGWPLRALAGRGGRGREPPPPSAGERGQLTPAPRSLTERLRPGQSPRALLRPRSPTARREGAARGGGSARCPAALHHCRKVRNTLPQRPRPRRKPASEGPSPLPPGSSWSSRPATAWEGPHCPALQGHTGITAGGRLHRSAIMRGFRAIDLFQLFIYMHR